jgi:hypothetical protein
MIPNPDNVNEGASMTLGSYDNTLFSSMLSAVLTTASTAGRTYTVSINPAKLSISNNLSGATALSFTAFYPQNLQQLLDFSTGCCTDSSSCGDKHCRFINSTSGRHTDRTVFGFQFENINTLTGGAVYANCSAHTMPYRDLPQDIRFESDRNLRIRIIDVSSGLPLSLNGGQFELLSEEML